MSAEYLIENYLSSLASHAPEMRDLHQTILELFPSVIQRYLDGKNEEGRLVTNPNIGYGTCLINYKDGTSREFYRLGISAKKTGISIYVMGLEDKNLLKEKFGQRIGKAKVSGYCISFRRLADLDEKILKELIQWALC